MKLTNIDSMRTLVPIVSVVFIFACGGNNTQTYMNEQGKDKTIKDKALNTGADILQNKAPLSAFNVYLNGFHFYNGNMDAQMEAHHYVSQLSEDFYQAIIFDGNSKDSKIMGIEYIVTEKLFNTLPKEEKKLWHSHHYEVKSGTLVAPGIPEAVEKELMEKLISTYGKTIHTWHTDQQHTLPIGSPMLMMGFTRDGQLKNDLLRDRDHRLGVSSRERKKQRSEIPFPTVDPMANAWEKGELRQFIVSDQVDSAQDKHQGLLPQRTK
ncbi:OBAP family protein [Olivibacter jilunii]